MPDRLAAAARRVAHWLPRDIARRAFWPSWYEVERRHAVLRRRAHAPSRRLWLVMRLALALISLTVQSAVVAIHDRRDRRTSIACLHRPHGAGPMLLQDLRFAARMLWKRPGFTLVAVAVLALSVGANAAMFSIVQRVLLRPLPFSEPERIVRINETFILGRTSVSPPNFVDWQAQNHTFESMSAYDEVTLTLGGDTAPERIDAALVGGTLFDVLGTRPALGRTFSPDEMRSGGPKAVILGYTLWLRRFGGDHAILGRSITLDAQRHVVIGVMSEGFTFPDGHDLWLPLIFTSSDLRPNQRGAHYVEAVGRLKRGVTREQAQADIAAIEQRLAQENVNVQGYGIWLEPIYDVIVGEYQRPLWMLLGAVGCVLLIGCANISNLLLARGTSRRTEITVRMALGASRWRIVRQLLAESTLLSMAGGAAGLVLAQWGRSIMTTLLPSDVPRGAAFDVDTTVLMFTLSISMLAGIVSGIAPALETSRGDLVTALKEARRDGTGGSRRRLRSTLVAAEVALALMLLAGAGLALRTFNRLTQIDTGFDARGTLAANVVIPEASYPDAPAVVRFYQSVIEALGRQPGVTEVGAVAIPPLARNGYGGTFTLIGKPEPEEEPRLAIRAATPGYLEAVRIPLIRGRRISHADHAKAPHIAVISEAAAQRYWANEDPIGQRIRIHVSGYIPEVEREIVGVVGDVKAGRIASAASPLVYLPHAQYPFEFMTIFIRTEGSPMALAPLVRAQVATIDPGIAVGGLRPGESLVADAVGQPRFRMVLLLAFAGTALALAALGVYGVMSFLVSQRRSEIGLRIALGASRTDVIHLVVRQGMGPVIAGALVGLTGTVAVRGVMRGLLFGIEPFDPVTFGLVVVLLAIVALGACYIPARRAARVDPLVALRAE